MPTHSPSVLARIRAAMRWLRRMRDDQRLLRAMSERELQDLGVGRSEIPGLTRALAQEHHTTHRQAIREALSDAAARWPASRTRRS